MEDWEIAQMKADLGNERRDVMSAPVDNKRARPEFDNPEQGQAIRDDFEQRRAKNRSAEGEHGARIAAWNTDTSFERDAVADQLQDRWSGQSHRANLTASLGFGREWEEAEARFGGERRNRVQGKAAGGGGRGGNYVATASPRGGLGSASRAIPRTFAGGDINNRAPERARVVSAPNLNRAPDPRAAGTVRFVHGVRRVDAAASSSRSVAPPSRAPALHPTAAAPRPATMAPRPSPAAPRPAAKAPGSQATTSPTQGHSAPRASVATSSSSSAAPQPATTARAHVPATQHPASAIMQFRPPYLGSAMLGPTASNLPVHSASDQQRFETLAEYYAANPGPESDQYHQEFPDRIRYLRPAWVRLIKLAFHHSDNPNDRDAERYRSTHRDREWIFTEAMRARDFVENRTQAEMDAFYAAHPEHIDFCKAARKYFTPKPQDEVVQHEPASSSQAVQPEQAIQTTQNNLTPASHSEPSTQAPVAQPETAFSEPMFAAQPTTASTDLVDLQNSSPSQGSPQSSSASSVETAISEPRLSALGMLSATFYDILGAYLGVTNTPIDVPAHVHVSITSQARRFDPRDLIPQIQALAERMQGLSNGGSYTTMMTTNIITTTTITRADQSGVGRATKQSQDGVRMTDDGLWVED